MRPILEIDESKCDGCGACATACHESAIAIVDGKAKLLRDDYCDGIGDCIGTCPTGALKIVQRDAVAYDAAAVARNRDAAAKSGARPAGGCPGARPRIVRPRVAARPDNPAAGTPAAGQLSNWPVQIKLMPTSGPALDGRDLLVAADCAAYACGDFHTRFMQGRTTAIGCPKLDGVDYADKLGEVLANNDVRSIVLTRMVVPCCGGLEQAARRAIDESGKDVPLEVVVIDFDGSIRTSR